MRPRQWTKNVFVLAPLVFDRQLTNPTALARSVAGMLLFCLISSCVYVLNDIMDVESDRVHPDKKNRPIASGALPIKGAYLLVAVLLLITIPLSFWLSPAYGIIALIYFGINLAYSIWLKHIPLIDVLIIAACYVLRVAAGVVLITVQRFSPWLYIVTTLFALFIGFGKRRAELSLLEGEAKSHRRVLDGYNIPLLDQLITIVSGTTVVAYSLYTFTAPNVPAKPCHDADHPLHSLRDLPLPVADQRQACRRGSRRAGFHRPTASGHHPALGAYRCSLIFYTYLTQCPRLPPTRLPNRSFSANMPSSTADPAIAIPVFERRSTTYILANPRGQTGEVTIEAPDIELNSSLGALDPSHPFRIAISRTQQAVGAASIPACQIRVVSTIPIASGLGIRRVHRGLARPRVFPVPRSPPFG